MTQVITLSHAGVRCALPAAQVLLAGEGTEPPIRLWRTSSSEREEGGDTRSLLVSTALGSRRVACAAPRFTSIDESAMMPLPEVLRAHMGLSHLVGVAQSDEMLIWLVDLLLWEGG